jgi:hypothetical protein
MKWPFNTKADTDLRIYRDSETDEVKLRLVGPIAFPAPTFPILAITITLEAVLDQEGIERLYKQLQHFAKDDLNGTEQGSISAGL